MIRLGGSRGAAAALAALPALLAPKPEGKPSPGHSFHLGKLESSLHQPVMGTEPQ